MSFLSSVFASATVDEPEATDPEALLQGWKSYAAAAPAAGKLDAAAAQQQPAPPPAGARAEGGDEGASGARPGGPGGLFFQKLQNGLNRLGNLDLASLDVDDVRQMASQAASKAAAAAANLNVKNAANTIQDKAKAAAAAAGQKAKAAGARLEEVGGAGLQRAAAGLQQAGGALKEGLQEGVQRVQSLSQERMLFFFSLMLFGNTLLSLAFFVGLPAAALAPAKFAIPFTMGSACDMVALASLRGYRAQLVHMMQRERLPFSTAYVGSMLATLWATFVMHSYALCVLFSMVQVVSLAYYFFSYFPGGLAGLKIVSMGVGRAIKPVLTAVTQCVLGGGSREGVGSLLPL